ncbi:MAG: TetR family transcriptional regulator [Deltaproteobacteria bacterium GWA2_54_12]|nr:MAG: TetR family transcriptional regulator [Deltaproteobacteria bacterium GWA2_54_12]
MKARSKHLPADERKAVTVDAVVELAAEQNPSGITTAAIAKRMRLTQGALFRHFPSKEAIWLAVLEWVAGKLMARTDKAAKTASSPLAALEAMFATHIDFIARHPGVPRVIFGELQNHDDTPAKLMVQTLINRYRKRLRVVMETGKSQGELDPDLDTKAAATLFIGMIQGLVIQSLLAGSAARLRKDAPGVFAVYLSGIRRSR